MKTLPGIRLVLVVALILGAPQPVIAQQKPPPLILPTTSIRMACMIWRLVNWKKLLQTFPQSNKFADALVYKGISQQKIGQHQEAIKTFEMLLSRSRIVCLLMMRCITSEKHIHDGKTTEALEVLNRLTSRYRESIFLLPGINLIGDIFMYQQKYSSAINPIFMSWNNRVFRVIVKK